MKKQDLKTGMQVELNDGDRYVVLLDTSVGDILCRINEGEWMNLTTHEDDLTYPSAPCFSIKRVYGGKCPHKFISEEMSDCYLLWERDEKVELTMDEIAEKFNIPVKNLKIKK